MSAQPKLEFWLCQRNRNLSISCARATKILRMMMFISNGGGSSDCTQIMYDDDPTFKPFIGSAGLGRAKTPDHFSGGHSLLWL
jgi:hypothetical protein